MSCQIYIWDCRPSLLMLPIIGLNKGGWAYSSGDLYVGCQTLKLLVRHPKKEPTSKNTSQQFMAESSYTPKPASKDPSARHPDVWPQSPKPGALHTRKALDPKS